MKFTPVDNRGLVEGFCLLKSVDKKTSSKGDTYLDITLADSEGEINAKLWNYNESMGIYEANTIVKVRGTISQYNGQDQFRIERMRKTNENDNVNPADFVKSANYSAEAMFDQLLCLAKGFKDKELNLLVTSLLEENREAMLYWPAAFKLHHAVRGGLLMHVLSIVRLAEAVCTVYPFVDKDLLLSGAILHDIAKLKEFVVCETGVATGYSVKGNLIGHLAEGAIMVREAAKRLNISEETSNLVEHMLLSHHGEPEFGAAVRPLFLEAELLSELDLMDSRIYEIKEALLNTAKGEFSQKMWAMDNRKFLNHNRVDLNTDADIVK